MQQSALKDLYVDQLRDLYDAEEQLTKALPKMAKAATSDELRSAFEQHLEQTKRHVARLEQIFESLGEKPTGKKCKGMKCLIAEGKEIMQNEGLESEALDAGLISAAQRAEHYEIAVYGCVGTYASLLGDKQAASLLRETLEEEKESDQKFTKLSETINVEAASEGADEAGEERQGGKGEKGRSAKA